MSSIIENSVSCHGIDDGSVGIDFEPGENKCMGMLEKKCEYE